MLALYINETKILMSRLLAGNAFDSFLLREGSVTTFCTFTIDGTFHPAFINATGSTDDAPKLSSWEMIRPHFYELIKGKRTPLNMKLVFQLTPDAMQHLLEHAGLSYCEEDIYAMYLNLIYDGKRVMITTGSSQKAFPPNADADRTWDTAVKNFLGKMQLEFDNA